MMMRRRIVVIDTRHRGRDGYRSVTIKFSAPCGSVRSSGMSMMM
jgi:hypothetical protein